MFTIKMNLIWETVGKNKLKKKEDYLSLMLNAILKKVNLHNKNRQPFPCCNLFNITTKVYSGKGYWGINQPWEEIESCRFSIEETS
jgi:hypothetical protein